MWHKQNLEHLAVALIRDGHGMDERRSKLTLRFCWYNNSSYSGNYKTTCLSLCSCFCLLFLSLYQDISSPFQSGGHVFKSRENFSYKFHDKFLSLICPVFSFWNSCYIFSSQIFLCVSMNYLKN